MVATPVGLPQRFIYITALSCLSLNGILQTSDELLNPGCIGPRLSEGQHYHWEFNVEGKALSVSASGSLLFDDDKLMVQAACHDAGIGLFYSH